MSIDYSTHYPTSGGTDYPTKIQSLIDALTVDVGSLMAAPFNAMINGDFQIWQRGSASTSCTAGARTFLADRFSVAPQGAAITQQRSTIVPSGSKARYSLQLNGAASVTACDFVQRVESLVSLPLKGKVSFSAKIYNDSGAPFVPQIIMSTPTTSDDWAGGSTARVTTNLQSCANAAWTTVTYTADWSSYPMENGSLVGIRIPSGSLVAGDIICITEVSLLPSTGSVAHDYWQRTIVDELALSQRYYQKSFPQSVAVAQNTSPSGACGYRVAVAGVGSAGAGVMVRFPVVMRATPTITYYNPSAANALWRNQADGADSGTPTTSAQHDSGFYIGNTQAAGDGAGELMLIHWSADSEL